MTHGLSVKTRLSFVVLAAIMLLQMLFASHAHAVTGSEWQAGRIIDDSVFTNDNSMSLSEVQWFLMSKVPSCDNSGQQMVTSSDGITSTRAAYADRKGNPKPSGQQTFTCLKDYYEVPKTAPGPAWPQSNYGYSSGNIPAGGRSAAQLILDAAHAYHISPKVLLVTLQKEQGLSFSKLASSCLG